MVIQLHCNKIKEKKTKKRGKRKNCLNQLWSTGTDLKLLYHFKLFSHHMSQAPYLWLKSVTCPRSC